MRGSYVKNVTMTRVITDTFLSYVIVITISCICEVEISIYYLGTSWVYIFILHGKKLLGVKLLYSAIAFPYLSYFKADFNNIHVCEAV